MDIEYYRQLALDNFGINQDHPGAFYGYPGAESGPGAGLIYCNVAFPDFNPKTRAFDTLEGTVYVLTHECDIDPDNRRHFNSHVLICPLIPLDDFLVSFAAKF